MMDASILELALHPPKPSDPIFDGGSISVKYDLDEANSLSLVTTIPFNYQDQLLISKNESDMIKSNILKNLKENLMNKTVSYDRKKSSILNLQTVLSRNIGGLNTQLNDIVRRILLTRQIPLDIMASLGDTNFLNCYCSCHFALRSYPIALLKFWRFEWYHPLYLGNPRCCRSI
jgi:hypothetical protein